MKKNKTFFTFTLPSFSCVFVPFQILTSFFSTYFSSLLSFNKCLLRMVMVWRWWRWLGDVYTHTRCSLLFIHLYTIYIYNMACCCHKVTSLFHTFHKEKRREGKKKSRKRVFRCSYNFVISTKNERTKREWKKKRARRSMKDFLLLRFSCLVWCTTCVTIQWQVEKDMPSWLDSLVYPYTLLLIQLGASTLTCDGMQMMMIMMTGETCIRCLGNTTTTKNETFLLFSLYFHSCKLLRISRSEIFLSKFLTYFFLLKELYTLLGDDDMMTTGKPTTEAYHTIILYVVDAFGFLLTFGIWEKYTSPKKRLVSSSSTTAVCWQLKVIIEWDVMEIGFEYGFFFGEDKKNLGDFYIDIIYYYVWFFCVHFLYSLIKDIWVAWHMRHLSSSFFSLVH